MDRKAEVAYLERVEHALETPDLNQAVALAREGVAQVPDSANLTCKLALILRQQNRTEEALTCLKAFDASYPDNLKIIVAMANANRAVGDTDATIECCERVLSSQPNHIGALCGLIGALVQAGKPERALELAQSAVARVPGEQKLEMKLVDVLRHRGAFADAHERLTDLAARNPTSAPIWTKLGDTLKRMGEAQDASIAFEKALEHDPKQLSAHEGLISLALGAGDLRRAERLCDRAISELPDAAQLLFNRSKIHRFSGQHSSAIELMEALLRDQPNNVWAMFEVARASLATSDYEKAIQHCKHALTLEPGRLSAWEILIDAVGSSFGPLKAIEIADLALQRCPGSLSIVDRRAKALANAGRFDEARALLEANDSDAPASIPLKLTLAKILTDFRDEAGADAVYRSALEINPKDTSVLIGRVELLVRKGEVAAALDLLNANRGLFQTNVRLMCKYASVLKNTGQRDEALRVLNTVQREKPDQVVVMMTLAEVLNEDGATAEAEAIYRKILSQHKGHHWALLGLTQCAKMRGDIRGAIDALRKGLTLSGDEDALGSSRAISPQDTSKLLWLADLLIRARETEDADRLIARLAPLSNTLPSHEVVQLLWLAGRSEGNSNLASVLRELADRDVYDVKLALAIVKAAFSSEIEDFAARVAKSIEKRVPANGRGEFAVGTAMMLKGPFAALSELRKLSFRALTPWDVVWVVHVLIACGKSETASRLLRAQMRRWPTNTALKATYVTAMIAAGDSDAALEWLQDHRPFFSQQRFSDLKVQLLLDNNREVEALELIEQEIQTGRRAPECEMHFKLLMSLGHLAEAQSAAKNVRSSPRTTASHDAHFSTTHWGALLNELKLYNVSREIVSDRSELVENFYYAALEEIDLWLKANPEDSISFTPDAEATKRIIQYWDRPPPPEEIGAAMERWQSAPGWNYEFFDRQKARRWLAEHLDRSYVRAFVSARKVAEEADFLRLCLLWHGGGVYADADDLLIGSPDELILDGRRLIVFREHFGALSNNLIYAPPRHPAIGRAMEMLRRALIRRDNDSVWLKSGPGLLTRAVASYLYNAPEASRKDTLILKRKIMFKHVKPHAPLPYKNTSSYWNPKSSKVRNTEVIDALARFAEIPSAAHGAVG